MPIPKETGISKGYLKQPDGIITFATDTPGLDRGGIVWNNVLYRVMGSKFCSVSPSGNITIIGDVGNDGNYVSMINSFDRLGIASNGNLFYYFNGALSRVTSPNLGLVLDVVWIDGYFVTTDGNSIVVTTLNDPFSVNPLAYGSSEVNPDPIVGLLKLRDELIAVNRYTVEFFNDIGGNLFPFQRIDGAELTRGSLSGTSFCALSGRNYYGQTTDLIVFLGSAKNEPLSIWTGYNGLTSCIATREVETIIQSYSEQQLSNVILENRVDKSQNLLYVHLPNQTLVYDTNASAISQAPVWFTLDSGLGDIATYRARNLVWSYGKWICGDTYSNSLGYFSDTVASHYGNDVTWEVYTLIFYNATNGAIFHELELVCLTGVVDAGKNPTIWQSYSTDGKTFSVERPKQIGKQGNYNSRINWLQCGNMRNFRIQKFRSDSSARLSIASLEARIEGLND